LHDEQGVSFRADGNLSEDVGGNKVVQGGRMTEPQIYNALVFLFIFAVGGYVVTKGEK
jgi:hypothetical protein